MTPLCLDKACLAAPLTQINRTDADKQGENYTGLAAKSKDRSGSSDDQSRKKSLFYFAARQMSTEKAFAFFV